MKRRLLVAYDGSGSSENAIVLAKTLAEHAAASVELATRDSKPVGSDAIVVGAGQLGRYGTTPVPSIEHLFRNSPPCMFVAPRGYADRWRQAPNLIAVESDDHADAADVSCAAEDLATWLGAGITSAASAAGPGNAGCDLLVLGSRHDEGEFALDQRASEVVVGTKVPLYVVPLRPVRLIEPGVPPLATAA